MKILALEPYYGGSHQSFIDSLSKFSSHDWTVLTLPPYKWKWRMRHSAVTFANQTKKLIGSGKKFNLLFCIDMLNLAEFKGLCSSKISSLPSVIYFHENQLTYPSRFPNERDYQFAMTNATSAMSADAVWFNSAFHRDDFLKALQKFFAKMPDYQPLGAIEAIRDKSEIHHPGINIIGQRPSITNTSPLRILWAGRWEHDKGPEDFFAAMKILKSKGIDFRLNILGEKFRDYPEIFDWAKDYFADHIDNFGYLPSRAEYQQVLFNSDIFVSTAIHEFFGIGFVEAAFAGAYPLLPDRLSYPEILKNICPSGSDRFLYDGSVEHLAEKLETLCNKISPDSLWHNFICLSGSLENYQWPRYVKAFDIALNKLFNN